MQVFSIYMTHFVSWSLCILVRSTECVWGSQQSNLLDESFKLMNLIWPSKHTRLHFLYFWQSHFAEQPTVLAWRVTSRIPWFQFHLHSQHGWKFQASSLHYQGWWHPLWKSHPSFLCILSLVPNQSWCSCVFAVQALRSIMQVWHDHDKAQPCKCADKQVCRHTGFHAATLYALMIRRSGISVHRSAEI